MANNMNFLDKCAEAITLDNLEAYEELIGRCEAFNTDEALAVALTGTGRTSLASICKLMLEDQQNRASDVTGSEVLMDAIKEEVSQWSADFSDVVSAGTIDIAAEVVAARKAGAMFSANLAKCLRHMQAISELISIHEGFNTVLGELKGDAPSPKKLDAIQQETVIDDTVDALIEADLKAVEHESVVVSKPVVPHGAYTPSADVADALSNLIRACERETVPPIDTRDRVFLGTVEHEEPSLAFEEPLFDIDAPVEMFITIDDEIDPSLSIAIQDALAEEQLLQECAIRDIEEHRNEYYNMGAYEVEPAPTTFRALESEEIPYPKDEGDYLGVDNESEDEVRAEDIYNLPTQSVSITREEKVIEPIRFEPEAAPLSEDEILDESLKVMIGDGNKPLSQEQMEQIAVDTGRDLDEVTARALDIKMGMAMSQKPDVAKEPY